MKRYLPILTALIFVLFLLYGCETTTEFTLTVEVLPGDGGTVIPESGSEFPEKTIVTLEPDPAAGYEFYGWDGEHGGEVQKDEGEWKLLMDGDKSIQAVFSELDYDATLEDIELEGAYLMRGEDHPPPMFGDPIFDPRITEYRTTTVIKEKEGIIVIPTASSSDSIIEVNGVAVESGESYFLSLDEGETPFEIVVTAGDGETQEIYTITAQKSSWKLVGERGFALGGGTSPRGLRIFGHDGDLFVGFLNHYDDNRATVMRYDGHSWEPVGEKGFSPKDLTNFSFYLDGGIPYVAFREPGEPAHMGKASVMKYDGEEWVNVGEPEFTEGFSGSTAYYMLDVCDGTPYLSFTSPLPGPISVMNYVDGEWDFVGEKAFSGRAAYPFPYVYEGTPYVAYSDLDNEGATIQKYDGEEWVIVGDAGFTPEGASTVSMDFDGGTPYIAFGDGPGLTKQLSVMRYNGLEWEMVGERFTTEDGADHPIINLHDGTPYVVYDGVEGFTDLGIVVVKYDGSDWVNVGGAGVSGSFYATMFQNLYISDDGTIYAVYRENIPEEDKAGITVRKFRE